MAKTVIDATGSFGWDSEYPYHRAKSNGFDTGWKSIELKKALSISSSAHNGSATLWGGIDGVYSPVSSSVSIQFRKDSSSGDIVSKSSFTKADIDELKKTCTYLYVRATASSGSSSSRGER